MKRSMNVLIGIVIILSIQTLGCTSDLKSAMVVSSSTQSSGVLNNRPLFPQDNNETSCETSSDRTSTDACPMSPSPAPTPTPSPVTGLMNPPPQTLPMECSCAGYLPDDPDITIALDSDSYSDMVILEPVPNMIQPSPDISYNTVCTIPNIGDQIMTNKMIDLSSCPNLTKNLYMFVVRNGGAQPVVVFDMLQAGNIYESQPVVSAIYRKDALSPWHYAYGFGISSFGESIGEYSKFNWGGNYLYSGYFAYSTTPGQTPSSIPLQRDEFTGLVLKPTLGETPFAICSLEQRGQTFCDDLSMVVGGIDPLLIELGNVSTAGDDFYLALTSVANGVMFDILGAKAKPVPHTKKKVPWVHSKNFGFLALPDSGSVTGIDQLFGNDTRGPDGGFASDGFAALAKYDLNRDGVIDAKDQVFPRLRVWVDANADGVAQASELKTLASLGIVSISLRYDAAFTETDHNGNMAKYKAIVTTASGEKHLIFDVWLR